MRLITISKTPLIFLILKSMLFTFIGWSSSSFGNELAIKDRLDVERGIESILTDVVAKHIDPKLFFLSVKVNLPEVPDKPVAADVSGTASTLPYTPLMVDLGFLSSLLKGGKVPTNFTNTVSSYEITLSFDKSVPKDKVKLVEDRVKYQFDIDNNERKLSVESLELVAANQELDPDEAAQVKLENAKLENQKSQLELERQKLQALKDIERLKEELKKKEAKPEAEKTEKPEDVIANEGKPFLETYQPLIIGVLLAVFGLVASFLISSSHKKGLTNVSDALGSVSESLAASAEGAGDSDSFAADMPSQLEGAVEAKEGASSGEPTSGEFDERFVQFIKLVEEKIEILSNEANFNFYRHFQDLVEDNLKYAAAILVSVGEKTAKSLLQSMAPETIAKIQDFLCEPGAHSQAQSLRTKALQDFYGRIAMDEYMGSPLGGIKNAEWIARLSNSDMRKFLLEIEDADRVSLFACLTPTRIALILDSCPDEVERTKLIRSIKDVDQQSDQDIDALFERLEKTYTASQEKVEEKVKKLVDGPRFFAKIVTDLKPDAREEFLKTLEDRQDLLDSMKQFYVPFSTVKNVTMKIVKDIFSKRPASQVAKIIFASDEVIRARVIEAMPEMLRDTVKEDLDTLDSDTSSQKQNRNMSLQLQDEISRFLLKMNKEGLLEYEESTDGESAPLAGVPNDSSSAA
jgi:hypothetical protein